MTQTPRHNLRVLHDADSVARRIADLARSIANDTKGRQLCLAPIAEGARVFAGRLAAELHRCGLDIEQMILRARRTRGARLVEPIIEIPPALSLTGRDVLVVDDIADEGRTLHATLARLRELGPGSLRTVVLVDKRVRRCVDVPLDYVGFQVADGWVVGIGMDLDESYRELDHLAVVENPEAR